MLPSRFTGYVEFVEGFRPRKDISHVLFDFDGTLSLIREGWIDVMVPLFAELLPHLPGETDATRQQLCREDILQLNGKQTIYQMIRLAERVKERGGVPREPIWYKQEYLRRLNLRIGSRVSDLRLGRVQPDTFLVYGVRSLLESLQRRGITMYLASGTDEPFVKEEAALLGLTPFFADHIYGAQYDYRKFSKKMLIEQILREHQIPGSRLLAFGDGYVEIQNTSEAGGLAVAVASDEAHNGSGIVDPWKRKRLLEVGAEVVIADYRDAESLLAMLLAE